MEAGSGTILILCVGLVLLSPRDVPLFARVAGRCCGVMVVTLRGARGAVSRVIAEAEGAGAAHGVKKEVREGLSQFEAMTGKLRREFEPLDFSPRSFLRSDGGALRGQSVPDSAAATVQGAGGMHLSGPGSELGKRKGNVMAAGERDFAQKPVGLASILPSAGGATGASSAADFIARNIEEASLLKQQQRVLGGKAKTQGEDTPDL